MALNLYDPEKHHIALGSLEDPSSSATEGLVGYWKLDDDLSVGSFSSPPYNWHNHDGYFQAVHKQDIVRDSSGLNNHLSYLRDTYSPTGDVVDHEAGALAADSAYAFRWPNVRAGCERLGGWNGIDSPVKTVSFWFKTPEFGTPSGYLLGSHEVGEGGGGFGANYGWAACLGGMAPIVAPGQVPGKLQIIYANNSYPSQIRLQGPEVDNNTWYHVVIVSDGTTNQLRVNGEMVDIWAGPNIVADHWIKLGYYGYKSGFQWLPGFAGDMALDEISMWTEPKLDFEDPSDGKLIGWTLENAYAKFVQRVPEPGAADIGGTLDLIAPEPEESIWTQDEFTGGTFQYRYDTDASMFADCTGYVPAQQSKSLYTVPPVFFKRNFNPAAYPNPAGRTNLVNPNSMFTVAGSIFCCFEHGIMRYLTGSDAFVWGNYMIDSSVDGNRHWYGGAEYDRNEQCIYVLVNCLDTTALDKPQLLRLDPETLEPWGTENQIFHNAPAKTNNQKGWGLNINDQHIVMGIGLRLYTCDPPEKPSDPDDKPVWTHIGRLPGRWADSVAYNGMTYIVSNTEDGKSQVVAFDGTYVLPVAMMAFNFRATCMTVYGGRIYIGGSGTDINGVNRYAELHELTGSSTRLVRTFAPESRQSRVTYPKEIWDLTVAEGLLWWAEKNVRLWTYDLTGDAFFGSSVIQHPGVNFYRQVVGRERLWLWGAHDSNPSQHGLYRIPIAGDAVADYSGQLVTSDFMNDFARDKEWHEIVVLTRYFPATRVDYSSDGGATWTTVGGGVASTSGDLHFLTVDLSGIPKSKVIRFRLWQPMATYVDVSGELIAFTVSFTVKEPDKPLKHGWNLIINAAENVEARDGSNQYQDVDEMKKVLWGWAETKAKLAFKDLGGKNYHVKLQDFVEQQPIIGPNVTDGENPEAYFAITLLEAIGDED